MLEKYLAGETDFDRFKLPTLNAVSLSVHNPKKSAENAQHLLKDAEFTATLLVIPLEVPNQKKNKNAKSKDLYVVKSNAFRHWNLVFRLPIIQLGKPENLRKLYDK
jgi:hypothetical protein